jgi:hypothetical protein
MSAVICVSVGARRVVYPMKVLMVGAICVMAGGHPALAQIDCTKTIKEAQTLKRNQQMTIARTAEGDFVFTFPSGRYIVRFGPLPPVPPGFPSHLLPPLGGGRPLVRSEIAEGIIPNDVDLSTLKGLAEAAMTYQSCVGVIG